MSDDEEIFGKRPQEYFKVNEKRSGGFVLACVYMAFMGCIPIFLGVLGFLRTYFPGAPDWFFVLNIILGILMVAGAIGTYYFKKSALYLFAATLIVDILFHLSLGFEELDAIHGLYFFIGFALVPVIPRWKFFK